MNHELNVNIRTIYYIRIPQKDNKSIRLIPVSIDAYKSPTGEIFILGDEEERINSIKKYYTDSE